MKPDSAHTLVEALADSGVRLTRQRRIVVGLLDEAETHLNAKELLRRAQEKDSGIDRATVYRTLGLLKHAGLIDELDLMHMEGEQHFYERRRPTDHIHVCCPACGRVEEMETGFIADMMAEIRKRIGFETDAVRIEVRARCPKCQEAV